MKKATIWLMVLAVLVASATPGKITSATSRAPDDYKKSYSTTQDFIWWLNDTTASRNEDWEIKYEQAYKAEQGYILTPKVEGAVLREVRVGIETAGIPICYVFKYENIQWNMYVYPVKYCREEEYYSDDIVTLAQNYYGGFTFDQPEERWYSDYNRRTPEGLFEKFKETVTYQKKELELGDSDTVDCVQQTFCSSYENPEWDHDDITLHFFKKNMYVRVICESVRDNGEKNLFEAMKKCTFEKIPTYPRLKLNKKKNKISKKNAILSATLNNPTNRKFTSVEFCLYDRKGKKIKVRSRRKVTKKSQEKDTVNIKFNVQKTIKEWRKKGTNKRKYPLERKKKYKYMIRAKVGGQYWETTGTFRWK